MKLIVPYPEFQEKEHAKNAKEAWDYAFRMVPQRAIEECKRVDIREGWDGSFKKGEVEPCVVDEESYEKYLKAVEESQNDLERFPEVRYIDLENDWVKPDFIGRKWLLGVYLSYKTLGSMSRVV